MAPVTIVLQFKSDGTLDISGPTENRILFLGMLELARDAVNHHHHQAALRVVPVTQIPGAQR